MLKATTLAPIHTYLADILWGLLLIILGQTSFNDKLDEFFDCCEFI